MANATFVHWKKCCEEALNCCDEMIKNPRGENFFNTCDSHWNGYSCFNEADSGVRVEKSCPYHLTKYDSSQCECEI